MPRTDAPVVLSFDVEEHYRIEAAAGLDCPDDLKGRYADRMDATTRWLVDRLGELGVRATFFIVGQIARSHPELVRLIHAAGHEVASHGWDHRRVHRFTPETFRDDLRLSCDALAEATGEAVAGYRAPTFSVTRQTAWAADVLAEAGLLYDSSVFPVRHDRYGVPDAPRKPFRLHGARHSILELPPATLRVFGQNLPVGGGGYFRLFPLALMGWGLRQLRRDGGVGSATMLYFHPWEFDPGQPRLKLSKLSSLRTYAGIAASRPRLLDLMSRYQFTRAVDVARGLAAVEPAGFRLVA